MVKGIGFLAGALFMAGVATVFSIGLFILPVAVVLLVFAAVWAHRHGKSQEFWIASTIGAAMVLLLIIGILRLQR